MMRYTRFRRETSTNPAKPSANSAGMLGSGTAVTKAEFDMVMLN